MSFEVELDRACELAREAGAAILEHYRAAPSSDGELDPVEAALAVAEKIIVAGLLETFADDGLVSKGSSETPDQFPGKRVWLVDPLDGMREFRARNGEFSVLLGLIVGGEPVLGVIHQPTTAVLYRAAQGSGAQVQRGEESATLTVSDVATTEGMVLVASRSHRDARTNDVQYLLGIGNALVSGSVGIKVALIAEQRCDVYVHTSGHTKAWDTCACEAILSEAGGMMTDCFGDPLRYDRRNVLHHRGIVASNGRAHEEIVDAAMRAIRGEIDDEDE